LPKLLVSSRELPSVSAFFGTHPVEVSYLIQSDVVHVAVVLVVFQFSLRVLIEISTRSKPHEPSFSRYTIFFEKSSKVISSVVQNVSGATKCQPIEFDAMNGKLFVYVRGAAGAVVSVVPRALRIRHFPQLAKLVFSFSRSTLFKYFTVH